LKVNRHSTPNRIVPGVLAVTLAILTIFAVWSVANSLTPVVRGKSSALPLADGLSPGQQRAQNLALSDARVQQRIAGRRAEVFGVREVLANQFTAASAPCAAADCRQVEIYLFDENAAVLAIVNLDTSEVLDVLYQPGVHPGISKQQADRALEIALAAPEVIEELGFRPLNADMAPVPADMPGTSCDGEHYCVGPNFERGERALWAIVDLTTGELAGTHWGKAVPDPPTNPIPSTPVGCPQPGSVNRDGWQLSYATTGTDGLRVYDVSYKGLEVLTSVKHLEWHVDYQIFGYRDEPGCGGGGGGFQIPPQGETRLITMTGNAGAPTGFEVVQDFRMSNWGATCNYRYENRLQFFSDGRFRIASAAYGRGCQPDGVYRPVVRIDLAVDGDDGDTFAYLEESGWHTVITETYRTPYDDPGHGPHVYDASGAGWSVFDDAGSGYFIVGDQGQYPQSRGATPFLYVAQHHDAEGETDMGPIGSCCEDNHMQGPHMYVDGENVQSTNIVLWYVAQMVTDTGASSGDPYCWTVSGEPAPETYPCIVGPLFVPFSPTTINYFPIMLRD